MPLTFKLKFILCDVQVRQYHIMDQSVKGEKASVVTDLIGMK